MFDQLYTLSDGQCVYQGSTRQLVPFLMTLDLECPSYHNPASYIIEVACGEHGDHTRKLVNAIENGKKDIRSEADYVKVAPMNGKSDIPKVHMTEANLKSTYEKNEKFADSQNGKALIPAKILNAIAKGDDNVAINVEEREPDTTTALLSEETGEISPERYPTSEFHQFWVVLKRTLLFSRRDWVRKYFIYLFKFNTLIDLGQTSLFY
jgi:ATP-binding cassette, subfamily G (WHITE), member 1